VFPSQGPDRMEQEIHHPTPRLPEGWKQFQAENIDITTSAEVLPSAASGRHSRSPSALSNHSPYTVQPSQIQQQPAQSLSEALFAIDSPDAGDFGLAPSQTTTSTSNGLSSSQTANPQFLSDGSPPGPFRPSLDDFDVPPGAWSPGLGTSNKSYFHPHGTAALNSTATLTHTNLNHNVPNSNAIADPVANNNNPAMNNNTLDDYYIAGPDPSSADPSANTTNFAVNAPIPFHEDPSTASPPLFQDFTLFDQPNQQQQQDNTPYSSPHSRRQQFDLENNPITTPGYLFTHYRTISEQSDISSAAASPFLGSVHSEHGSPYITAQQDTALEDELNDAIVGLDMGVSIETAYPQPSFDPSSLALDSQGFPLDAPLESSARYDQDQQYSYDAQHSRPSSSGSYHPTFSQTIFAPAQISTSISQAFTSPPPPSATSIPEIEVTVAPPTPRTQTFPDPYDYFPPSYRASHPPPQTSSAHGSPSMVPTYIFNSQDVPALSLPPSGGRRRAVSDSGTRPPLQMNPPGQPITLQRRVSSGSHPYLGVQNIDSIQPSSSGRSTPSRSHRKSFSYSGSHNLTAREVLELVKPEGPREAKNPKKFVCDFPGCGQRFTRNSNKTTHMLTHKNERPHVCPHCHKDFTRQHDWKRHMELHDPNKRFKCAGFLVDGRPWGCNKEFARKDALSRHFKSQQVLTPLFIIEIR